MEVLGWILLEVSLTVKLGVACVVLFLLYDWWCHQYFQRQGIPVGPYYPVIGSLSKMRQSLGFQFAKKYPKKYGRIFGWYTGRAPQLVVNDADALQHIFVKSFSHFVNRQTNLIRTKPLDKGLLALRDEHWKDVRAVVSPAFSAAKLKKMTSMINKCCDTLVANFGRAVSDGKPADCKKLYGAFTMETVAWCGFGLRVRSQESGDEEDEFVTKAQRAFQFQFRTGWQALALFFPPLLPVFNYLKLGHMPADVTSFFSRVTEQACRLRQGSETAAANEQIDMLQLMLNAHEEKASPEDGATPASGVDGHVTGTGPGGVKRRMLTSEEVTAQAMTFFLAGYETTSALLGFASYLLARHPALQDRLHAEILATVPTRAEVSLEALNKMTYLDMVVSEALRCYPPAGGFVRSCTKDFSYNGMTIERGTHVYTNIWAVHYDEEYWPDPDKFDPERFSAENKGSIRPCTWLPFGFGPRNCIGMRFALLEAKMALVRVLQEYRLDTCPATQIPPKLANGPFAATAEGIQLRPVPRK